MLRSDDSTDDLRRAGIGEVGGDYRRPAEAGGEGVEALLAGGDEDQPAPGKR